MTIEYSNLDPTTGKAGWFNREVHATMRPKPRIGQWAGDGPLTTWNTHPAGPVGSKSYDKVESYRQGAIFQFRATGLFYRFDFYYVYAMLISGLVLLSAAKTVAETYAMYFAPNALMIRNRTRDVFELDQRFSDIGLKAAVAASAFDAIDKGADNTIECHDLCASFAKIPNINFEQAWAVVCRPCSKLLLITAPVSMVRRQCFPK